MKLDIYQIDAFTNRIFGGNPACVIPLKEWLADAILLQIAKDPSVVLCLSSQCNNAMQAVRRMAIKLMQLDIRQPIILVTDSQWKTTDEHLIHFAIEITEIPCGHSISQALVSEQFPKPSPSICFTIETARLGASNFPCGKSARCVILAPTNKAALAFLHVATQAPHPIQAAASKAASAVSYEIGILFASGAWPVEAPINPPEAIMESNAFRSIFKSLKTGKAFARKGSI